MVREEGKDVCIASSTLNPDLRLLLFNAGYPNCPSRDEAEQGFRDRGYRRAGFTLTGFVKLWFRNDAFFEPMWVVARYNVELTLMLFGGTHWICACVLCFAVIHYSSITNDGLLAPSGLPFHTAQGKWGEKRTARNGPGTSRHNECVPRISSSYAGQNTHTTHTFTAASPCPPAGTENLNDTSLQWPCFALQLSLFSLMGWYGPVLLDFGLAHSS